MSSLRAACLILAMLCLVNPAIRAQASDAAAKVNITFTLSRRSKTASDQLAAWIEDEKGGFVRTLFVTNFVGKRAGWKNRPQTTPTWARTANVKNTPQSEIDAVSGATPKSGTVSVLWDLKDSTGNLVPKGTYKYRIEGNISWENTVLWTGVIHVGGARESSQATAVYTPVDAEKLGQLISSVSAQYEPGT